MKNALWGCVVLALAIATPSRADEASKQAKLTELMKVQGLYGMVEMMRADGRKRLEAQRPQYVKQIQEAFPNAPADYWAHFDASYAQLLDADGKILSTDSAIALFAKLYGAQVTEGELDQILAFYQSPAGQKDIQATNAITPQWSAQLAEMTQGPGKANMQVFIDDLKVYLQQCRAAVAAGSKTCEKSVPEGGKT